MPDNFEDMGWRSNQLLTNISATLVQILGALDVLKGLAAQEITAQLAIKNSLTQVSSTLQQIKSALIPVPAKFIVTITSNSKENLMAGKLKASVDFQLLDNGTATATLSLVDAAGLPASLPAGSTLSVPPWAPSAPSLVVTPAADGMSATLAPATPPVLATDVTITIGPATMTNADGSTTSIPAIVSEGVDIVSGGPAGFQVQL